MMTTDAAADPRVGTRVGSYRLDALVGVGGMGIVYRATAPDGSSVALKLAKPDFARDETFRRRFEREARIAQTVRNRYVVPVLDSGLHEEVPFLAARFIEGESLEERLRREGRLDVLTTVTVCAQAGQGLAALASAGIVHRDVKPGNILIDRAGTAYITDFGLAKDPDGGVLTLPGQALGSRCYMAPEQIRSEAVTAATDVYALACVVFECLQGRPPFAERPGLHALWAHLQDEPPALSRQRGDVRPAVEDVWRTAMAKEPSRRPQSCADFAAALADAAGYPAPSG